MAVAFSKPLKFLEQPDQWKRPVELIAKRQRKQDRYQYVNLTRSLATVHDAQPVRRDDQGA
jgi:hypothetical protein